MGDDKAMLLFLRRGFVECGRVLEKWFEWDGVKAWRIRVGRRELRE